MQWLDSKKIEKGEKLGAYWQIYQAKDMDTIREFLTEVGNIVSYALRKQLYEHFGVSSKTIFQFWGDSLYIPTGAPHQVELLILYYEKWIDMIVFLGTVFPELSKGS